jgi:hypothetical protein
MTLIDNWRSAWRMFSVWMMTAAGVLQSRVGPPTPKR